MCGRDVLSTTTIEIVVEVQIQILLIRLRHITQLDSLSHSKIMGILITGSDEEKGAVESHAGHKLFPISAHG